MQNHRKPFQTLPEMFDDDDVDIGLLQSYHSSKIELLFRSPDLEFLHIFEICTKILQGASVLTSRSHVQPAKAKDELESDLRIGKADKAREP